MYFTINYSPNGEDVFNLITSALDDLDLDWINPMEEMILVKTSSDYVREDVYDKLIKLQDSDNGIDFQFLMSPLYFRGQYSGRISRNAQYKASNRGQSEKEQLTLERLDQFTFAW